LPLSGHSFGTEWGDLHCAFTGTAMASGDQYRIKAAWLHASALYAPSPRLRVQYESLSRAYLRLAEQADRNNAADITYEPPPPKIDNPDRKQ